jgi:hypothetical protein
MKGKTLLFFTIQACDAWDKKTGDLRNVIQIEVLANDYKEAIEKAKKLAPGKKVYRYFGVVEELLNK